MCSVRFSYSSTYSCGRVVQLAQQDLLVAERERA